MTSTISPKEEAVATRPLTEIERQNRIVAALGNDFLFPLFNGRQAIESQRKSAYKSTPRAAREIIDNAYEAGARNVWVAFRRAEDGSRAKRERRDAVTAIAFIDNGPGMTPKMARYALSWGGGSHFDNPTGIGRFGFGLPNSSINQTRRVEVYTRTSAEQSWIRVVLDITPGVLESLPPSGLVQIAPHEENVPLPTFVVDYIDRNRIKLGSGTVVVWEKPDRLSAKGAAKLRDYMVDDFGVVYRYLLDETRFNLVVDTTPVQVVDPLFLMPNGRYYLSPDKGGATITYQRNLTVKHTREPESGVQHLELLRSAEAIREAKRAAAEDENVAVGTIAVTVARFPYGFVARRVQEDRSIDGPVAKDADAFKRIQIRAKRRGITFVRANREIDTVDAFPTTAADRANGLGRWPVLQGYALHWGVEVRFSPNLDEIMSTSNDKQTLNPSEDFWRVLKDAEVDRALREENQYQQKTRQKEEERAAEEEAKNPDKPNPATEAAAEAETMMGRRHVVPTDAGTPAPSGSSGASGTQPSGSENQGGGGPQTSTLGDQPGAPAGDPATDTPPGPAVEEPTTITYGIGFFASEGGVFYKPQFDDNLKRMALINTAHPFFKVFYTELVKIKNPKARQAVDLLLLALSQAELFADRRTKLIYEHQRESEWSPFLKLGFGILRDLDPADPEEAEEDVSVED